MTDRSVADIVNYPGDKLDKAYINLWNFIAEGLMVNGVPKENIAIGGTDTVQIEIVIPIVGNLVKQVAWRYSVC